MCNRLNVRASRAERDIKSAAQYLHEQRQILPGSSSSDSNRPRQEAVEIIGDPEPDVEAFNAEYQRYREAVLRDADDAPAHLKGTTVANLQTTVMALERQMARMRLEYEAAASRAQSAAASDSVLQQQPLQPPPMMPQQMGQPPLQPQSMVQPIQAREVSSFAQPDMEEEKVDPAMQAATAAIQEQTATLLA